MKDFRLQLEQGDPHGCLEEMNYSVRIRNRAIKKALLRQVKSSRIPLDEILEWLWDDFGRKPARNWRNIEKTILGDNDITPQDLAVFMIDQGILPDEGAWNVKPATGLPGRKGRIRDSGGGEGRDPQI